MKQPGAAQILIAAPRLQIAGDADQVRQETFVSRMRHVLGAETAEELDHRPVVGIHWFTLQVHFWRWRRSCHVHQIKIISTLSHGGPSEGDWACHPRSDN